MPLESRSADRAGTMWSDKRKINVLYVSNQKRLLGGAERIMRDLIAAIDRSRVTPFFASIYDEELASLIKQSGVSYLKLGEFRRSNPLHYLYSQLQLIYFILKNRIQIIHNNQCQDVFYSWLPAVLTNTRIIIHHRDSSPLTARDVFFINHVDCNLCMSSWQNEHFLENRAILVHEGVDLARIPIQPNGYRTKPANPAKGAVVVGLAGRIAPIKGHHIFVEAARIVLDQEPDTRFVIVGDTTSGYFADYYQQLKSRIDTLGMRECVIFQGFMRNPDEIYPQMDISVVPSLREPFGMVMLEAMAFSKPVVATNVGGPLDIVTDKTGILVPVNDPAALAAAILRLVRDPYLREKMGNAGRDRIETHFTMEKSLARLYEIYDDLLCRNTEVSQCEETVRS